MSAGGDVLDFALAIEHREAGRYDEAIAWLKAWLAKNQDDAVAYAHLSHVLSLKQQDQEAWSALNSAQEIDAALPIVQRSHARLLLRKGDPQLAVKIASKACELAPDDRDNQLVLASSLAASGQLDKALTVANGLISLWSRFAEAYGARAHLRQALGMPAEALQDAEAAVSIKPHLVSLWVLVFKLQRQINGLAASIEALQKALCCNPDNANLMVELAMLKAEAGEEEAIPLLGEAIKRASDGRTFKLLRERVMSCPLDEDHLIPLVAFLLRKSEFHKGACRTRLAVLYCELVRPWLFWAIETGRFNLALQLETFIYDQYVKQTETEEHFRNVVSEWVEPMRQAGHRLTASLPPLRRPPRSKPWRIALILHNATILAHVQTMLSMLMGYSRLEDKPMEFSVICLSGRSVALESQLETMGIESVFIEQKYPEAAGDYCRSILRLREHLEASKVHLAVWVSIVTNMSFAFALRLAPVQIWWAMKYHSMDFPEIDAYLANGSFERFREINGRPWRIVHGATDLTLPDSVPEAARLRTEIGRGRLIFGCMGREEKLDSPEFLEAVCQILKARPDTVFLWTGRQPLEAITAHFQKAGLAERHCFVGWIDTGLYAQVIDIYLDTFPFGGGHTVVQSMAAGVPAVMYLSPENMESGIPMSILPVLEGRAGTPEETADVRAIFDMAGERRLLIAETPEQYVEWAVRLIDDPGFRKRIGEAGKIFAEKYFSDLPRFAKSFVEHMDEILSAADLP